MPNALRTLQGFLRIKCFTKRVLRRMDLRLTQCLIPALLCGPLVAQIKSPVRLSTPAFSNSAASLQTPSATDRSQIAPTTLTLQDAIRLAQANVPVYLASLSDANVAREDIRQARAAVRPSASFLSEYLNTQGNGTLPEGRFVTNNGVHVYRD